MEEVPSIFKNFKNAICGQRSSESFKIENTSKETKTYKIVRRKRSKKAEVSEIRLQINPEEMKILPGKTSTFTVSYMSYLENVADNYFYDIMESEKIIARLNIHARSVGPAFNFSKINLIFITSPGMSRVTKTVEVANRSECEVKFCFDLDEDYQIVKVNEIRGTFLAESKFTLKLMFQPTKPGVYYKQIFCLVQYHKPLLFNILGVHKPKDNVDPKNFLYPSMRSYTNNYEFYMTKLNQINCTEDSRKHFLCKHSTDPNLALNEITKEKNFGQKSLEISSSKPLQSSGKQFVDNLLEEVFLNSYFVDVKNCAESNKATTLINLSTSRQFFYRWGHDPKNHFRIKPRKGLIDPNDRVDFAISFTSPISDVFYHAEMDLQIFPCIDEARQEPSKHITLPLTKTLRIIGHSFPKDSCGWIPQCSVIPKRLRLPSCVPEETVYGTFKIERRGHLPATFAIFPPKESFYIVQPSIGFFSGDFQLFVIQFKCKKEGVYEDELKIVYNNSSSIYEMLKVTISVEVPDLIFGKNNTYAFGPSFPKSKMAEKVALENPTNLYQNYEFIIPEDVTWIKIPNHKGSIEPLAFDAVEMIFEPQAPCEYLDCITCKVSSTTFPEFFKLIQIQIVGSCQFGYLIATPSIKDFGECIYNTEKTMTIHLFNFSPVLLHFQLQNIHRAFPVGDPEKDVRISPSKGKVPGKGSLAIEVGITPHGIDTFQYAIECQILENDFEGAAPCEDPRKIFYFRFDGVLPAFQIVDLNVDGGGPLFSPHWVWKMMNINQINKALKSLKAEEQIEMRFPEAVIMMKSVTIALLIEANEHGEIVWSFQKKIMCPCFKASKGEFADGCFHSKAVTVTPTEFKMEIVYWSFSQPKKRVILQFVINYDNIGECITQWVFQLPFHRKVFLNAKIVSLPVEEPNLTSMYLPPIFNLKPVFVGDPDPPIQLFWLYNNTNHTTSYVVDKLALRKALALEHPIFDCINCNGVLPPFSCLPLKFVFKPNQIKSYKAQVYLCLRENKLTTVSLKGEGVPNIQQFSDFVMEKTVPVTPILYNANVDVEFNINLIYIKFFRTFSKIKRMFFLRNRSQTEIWAFQWHNFRAEGLIKAQIEPMNGMIEPNQELAMTLSLQSFSHPTSISFSIPCDVINYSKLKSFQAALKYGDTMSEKYKNYFTITEKGIFYETPNIPTPEEPDSSHLYITVNTNIVSGLIIDNKLTLKQQLILEAEEELESEESLLPSNSIFIIPSTQQFLEKLLWKILESVTFKAKVKSLDKLQDYNYLQIPTENENATSEISEFPIKTIAQSYIENMFKKILTKTFIEEDLKANDEVSDQ